MQTLGENAVVMPNDDAAKCGIAELNGLLRKEERMTEPSDVTVGGLIPMQHTDRMYGAVRTVSIVADL